MYLTSLNLLPSGFPLASSITTLCNTHDCVYFINHPQKTLSIVICDYTSLLSLLCGKVNKQDLWIGKWNLVEDACCFFCKGSFLNVITTFRKYCYLIKSYHEIITFRYICYRFNISSINSKCLFL